MSTVHLVMQGKGGVGKSLVAVLIAQHRRERGRPLLCIDTDPVNETLSSYGALSDVAAQLDLVQDQRIAPEAFDRMIDMIAGHDGEVVIDTGASIFLSMSLYLVENEAVGTLQDLGHHVVVHTVITGGQALVDTVNGFEALVGQFPESVEIVVWLNEFLGVVEQDGKLFEQMAAYQRHHARVHGMVTIRQGSELFARDLKKILEARQTFAEALDDPRHTLMSRIRLKKIRDSIFDQLDVVLGMGEAQTLGDSEGNANGSD